MGQRTAAGKSTLMGFTVLTTTKNTAKSRFAANTAKSTRRHMPTERYINSKLGKESYAMSIASDLIRGHTDTIILAQLSCADSYGYKINKTIQKKTNHEYELKEATLYSAFKRLEQAGYIRSYWGNENTGARRRYYSITPEGRTAYRRLKEDWNSSKKLIDILISVNETEYGNAERNGGD